ncbi:hypothetical protein SASPL_105100 [Salvia splendens]|uniref:Uncharacterized protein n=1 Tax=Salvia splendens TaxID=180675 RepID=A0A8X8YNX9_SALSN|nr:hypothetical protein SASPL_105100 [Salvia splendens]
MAGKLVRVQKRAQDPSRIPILFPADEHGDAALDNVEFGLLLLGHVGALAREAGAPLGRAPGEGGFRGGGPGEGGRVLGGEAFL